MNFFNKIPTINYDNNMARNILARAKLSDATKANSRLFLPYTTSGEERIDTLAQQYYGSANYTWLIWFANETIDPYYGMALNEYDLEQYIITKYGSIDIAQRKIIHYKNNWETDPTKLTVDIFNSMQSGAQKYWAPVLDYNLQVKSYTRKQDNQILNTNRLASINIIGATGDFKVGEEIRDADDATIYGFCTYSDGSTITVQHVSGSFDTDMTVVGKESGSQATVIDANNTLSVTSAYTEAIYWSPVTAYDYEVALNESKKTIVLMDAMYAGQADQDLKRVMNTV